MTSTFLFVARGALMAAAVLAQAPAATTYRLTDITVSGARRYSVADVWKVSGLSIGQSLAVPDLAAAANRLSASGLFKSVRYRYVTMADRMTAAFDIEEADWTVPVVFDNFVWFTDADVIAAVRADVPSFEGVAPATEGITELITRSLSTLLASRQLPGQVRYTPESDLRGNLLRHIFSVDDPGPRICTVRFEGAAEIAERELLDAAPALKGGDYSRVRVASLVDGTLVDMYRRRGHWTAAFLTPAPRFDAGCGGVNLVLQVTEGPAYAFGRADWTGNTLLATPELDRLLALERGETAGLLRIEDGLREVRKAYGQRGYIEQSAQYTPTTDETSQRVIIKVAIVEGPQFRMGTVDFVGFSERVAAELRKNWRLEPGDVYDADYASRFNFEEMLPRLRGGGASTQLPMIESRVDPEKRIVDLRLVSP